MKADFENKEGYKVLYVLGQPHQAEKIVKKDNYIYGYINRKIAWYFPNIVNIDDFNLEDGQGWDLTEEDEQALYQLDLDFRLSMLELGGMI